MTPQATPSEGRGGARAWAELLRLPALFTVPGDALAGAAATGRRPNHRTLLAIGSSLCLYEAGMALNDWADRADDAVERPHRPLPSGRIAPAAALTAAGGLTLAGLALAARAGRPALTVASSLAATVWAYDLGLKHTPMGPATMATARTLDLLLGATATTGVARGERSGASNGGRPVSGRPARGGPVSGRPMRGGPVSGRPMRGLPVRGRRMRGLPVPQPLPTAPALGTPRHGGPPSRPRPTVAAAAISPGKATGRVRDALPSAVALGVHTLVVTTVSRREAQGGSSAAPLAALAVTAVLGQLLTHGRPRRHSIRGAGQPPRTPRDTARSLLGAAYAATAARPLAHAALNPSPQLTQRAVGGGIRAMIPLQAALAARSGALGTALATAALAPLAGKLARKVSVT
ncbi:UbiA family prenyltransferase [Streptomyces sp. E11-3]|uniref:UbiA family prenyltransferase n=1 Tax=Streptomyces sp. E11-3 TaxID=3110112 RepID=UPI00397F9F79